MEERPEDLARQLIELLNQRLARNEDAEAAIAVYKIANYVESQLQGIKQSSIELAEQDMEQRDLEHLRTVEGSAGWTEPKVRQLNERAWLEALARDPLLMKIQRDYDLAQAGLQRAQEPYMELPESRFFIR